MITVYSNEILLATRDFHKVKISTLCPCTEVPIPTDCLLPHVLICTVGPRKPGSESHLAIIRCDHMSHPQHPPQ